MEDSAYVYAHAHPGTGELLYIGRGVNSRAWDINSRKPGHRETLLELNDEFGRGAYVLIIADDLSSDEAAAAEVHIIHRLKPPFNTQVHQPSDVLIDDFRDMLSEGFEFNWGSKVRPHS